MTVNHIHCPGKKPYIIPRGGSSDRSIWGYIDCWSEMENQDYFNEITDIVVSGSGGTDLDLALANYWSGLRKRVHEVRIWGESKDFFLTCEAFFRLVSKKSKGQIVSRTGFISETEVVDGEFETTQSKLELKNVPIEDIIDIIDGYVGKHRFIS